MKRFWRNRILIILLAFVISVGGSGYLMQVQQGRLKQQVSADASANMVIPGGMPVGIYLETEGVLVLGTEAIEGVDGQMHEPAEHLVKKGDYIIGLNDREITDKEELIAAVKSMNEEEVILKVVRNHQSIRVRMNAVKSGYDDYKLGIWVRDNAQGLGTITYLTPSSTFGALGHGIHDTDTGELLNISKGFLYATNIHDVQKGENGNPGGMEGVIVYNNYNMLGTVSQNTTEGIFGTLNRVDTLFQSEDPVEIAENHEIREGTASIRCSVEGEVKEYEVKITGVNPLAGEKNKTLEIQVTDQRLLAVTGGIIQGMSGSPILQNGRLVGAVTHVFINDPTRGYGIMIEDMIQVSGSDTIREK